MTCTERSVEHGSLGFAACGRRTTTVGLDEGCFPGRVGAMVEIPTADWSWIDAAAERFERAWKEGPRPRIEDYLNEVEEPRRTRLLDELLGSRSSCAGGAESGRARKNTTTRFPAHATVVRRRLLRREGAAFLGCRSTYQTGPRALLALRPVPDSRRTGRAGRDERPVPRVLLRDTEAEPQTPVVRPSSAEMPEETGRYQLLGEIGRGGMGAVLKGRDPDLGRDLAVKVLLEEHQDDPELVRRFVEEAQIGGQLQHPGHRARLRARHSSATAGPTSP